MKATKRATSDLLPYVLPTATGLLGLLFAPVVEAARLSPQARRDCGPGRGGCQRGGCAALRAPASTSTGRTANLERPSSVSRMSPKPPLGLAPRRGF